MASTTPDRITCPACGAIYRWADHLAGHKIRCKCGATLRMPKESTGQATLVSNAKAAPASAPTPAAAQPPPAEAARKPEADGGEYDLDLPAENDLKPAAAPAASDGKCPSCRQPVKPTAVICMNCGFNLAEGKKLSTAVGDDAPLPQTGKKSKRKADEEEAAHAEKKAKFTDIYAPIGLVIGSVVFILLNAFLLLRLTPSFAKRVADGVEPMAISLREMKHAGVSFAVNIPFLFVGILIVAKMMGAAFGSLFTAILKLAAITIFMIAFAQLMFSGVDIITGGEGWMAEIFGHSVNFGVFMALAIWMFDLDGSEAFFLYALTILLPILANMFLISTFVN